MIRFHDRYRSARFWAISLLFWFIVLNLLSHGDRFHPPGAFAFDIPHFDKVVHFGYFFGGGGLFAAALFFKKLKPSLLHRPSFPSCALSRVEIPRR
ncbi:hypothetical protein N9965_01500, partial [bacterium]|nr:hypothetical protein [bacterium]